MEEEMLNTTIVSIHQPQATLCWATTSILLHHQLLVVKRLVVEDVSCCGDGMEEHIIVVFGRAQPRPVDDDIAPRQVSSAKRS
eukprot:scaffold3874_cov71-Skeletonema_dohrnii-CCMP3373.AAC.3